MRILILIISTISLVYSTNAQLLTYPNNNQAIFWEVSHPNSSKKSYVLGTMHIIQKEYFIFPKEIKKALKKSSSLILELDKLPNPALFLKLTKLDTGNFFNYFSNIETDSIIDWANNKLHIPPQVFRSTFYKTKPFVVSQIATQSLFDGKTESYENRIYHYSKDKKKPIIGLETIEFQISLMDTLPIKIQKRMLLDIISNEQEVKENLLMLQKIYREQKIDSLYHQLNEEFETFDKYESLFITDRNQKWLPILEENFLINSCFVAVGAGHLGGPNGLLQLLNSKGYHLKPIYFKKK
jgi:uncharacterized protein